MKATWNRHPIVAYCHRHKEPRPLYKGRPCGSCGNNRRSANFNIRNPETKRVTALESARRQRQLENYKIAYRKSKYGISDEVWKVMIAAQKNLCAICDKDNNQYELCIDHDHKTGKVRGLLCKRCNTGIGLLEDNCSNLLKAIEYLRKFQ